MNTLYIVGGIIVALLILNPIVVLLLPHRITGKAVLKRELSRHGVITQRLPKECLEHLVAHAETEAKDRVARGDGDNFPNTFITVLGELGREAAEHIKQPSRKNKSVAAEILRRHGV